MEEHRPLTLPFEIVFLIWKSQTKYIQTSNLHMTPTLCKLTEWRSVKPLLIGSQMPNVTDAEKQDILSQIVPTRIRNVKISGRLKVDSKENHEEGLTRETKEKEKGRHAELDL